MFDTLRNLTRTAEEKRQEQLNAYLDGELRGPALEQFEALLADDPTMRAEVAELRAIKEQVGQLPRLRAPRNYTLDPARYAAPAPARGLALYPALRLATALTAFFLILTVGLDVLPRQQQAAMAPDAGSVASVEMAVEEDAVARVEAPQAPVLEPEREITRVVTEVMVEGEEAAAEPFLTEPLTATEVITEDVEMLALPAPEAADVEETAAEVLAEEAPAPLASPGYPAFDIIAAPTATTVPDAAPPAGSLAQEPAASPLRLAQIALAITLLVLLVVTLLLRRQLV